MNNDATQQHLEIMDAVAGIVASTDDIETMLVRLLDGMLNYFSCDRSWLLYPCDPDTPTWQVPMERTVPQWPGAYEQGLEMPMHEQVRFVFEAAVATDRPVTFDDASELQVPPVITELFGVRSQMILCVRPKTDRAWMLGVHHCSASHVYTEAEKRLLVAIGGRLGDSLSTLVALRDLRATESRLERAVADRTAELRHANEELGAFSSSVSHDLLTPIRIITAYGDLLAEHLGDNLDETAQLYLGHIVDSAKRADSTIRSLHRLSRATRANLKRESINVSVMARRIAESLQGEDPGRNAEFAIADGLTMVADRGLLNVALENLMRNAWKYTAREAMPRIEVAAMPDADVPTLQVRDNGIGFDMNQAQGLFDTFVRLDGSRGFDGSGVGLATVRRIAARHDGRVWATSKPGDGASFFLEIPPQQDTD